MDEKYYYLIKFRYDYGVYSLKEMCELVNEGKITEEQFHFITTYDYKTIEKERG